MFEKFKPDAASWRYLNFYFGCCWNLLGILNNCIISFQKCDHDRQWAHFSRIRLWWVIWNMKGEKWLFAREVINSNAWNQSILFLSCTSGCPLQNIGSRYLCHLMFYFPIIDWFLSILYMYWFTMSDRNWLLLLLLFGLISVQLEFNYPIIQSVHYTYTIIISIIVSMPCACGIGNRFPLPLLLRGILV